MFHVVIPPESSSTPPAAGAASGRRPLDAQGRLTGPVATGHKTFDRAAAECGPSTGNIVSPIQFSNYIRAAGETRCNGCDFLPGALQAHDFKVIGFATLPRAVQERLRALAQDQEVIFYKIRHSIRRRTTVHGYLITDTAHQLLARWTTGPTWRSHAVMDEMVLRITVAHSAHERLRRQRMMAG